MLMMYKLDLDTPTTYEEWLSTDVGNNTTYKNKIEALLSDDPGLSDTITEYFFDWDIGWNNAELFWRYFARNISANIGQFREMLRIQPGVAKYDWMVQDYQERQLETVIDNTNTTSRANDEQITTASKSGTAAQSASGNSSTIQTGGETNTHTGTDTGEKSGTDSTAHTGTETNELTGESSEIHTGGYKETDIEGEHTEDINKVEGLTTQEYSPHVSKKTQNGGHSGEWAGDMHVEATNPMSKSYDYQQTVEPRDETIADAGSQNNYFKSRAYQGMPSTDADGHHDAYLNWKTVSAQAQNASRHYSADRSNVTETYEYNSKEQGDITTNQGSADNPETQAKTRKGSKTDPDTKEVVYNADTKAGNESKTGTKTINTKDTTDYGTTDKTTYNTTDKKTYDSVTNEGTNESSLSTNNSSAENKNVTQSYGNITQNGSSSFSDKEITTGRSGADMGTLLQNAKNFIARSNAWFWFREQLIPCFESEMI